MGNVQMSCHGANAIILGKMVACRYLDAGRHFSMIMYALLANGEFLTLHDTETIKAKEHSLKICRCSYNQTNLDGFSTTKCQLFFKHQILIARPFL